MAIKTFTTGEVLTAADTNTYLNNGGLVYIETLTISGATSGYTDTAFTSAYKNYRIVGTFTSTTAVNLIFTFRSASGDVTASNYKYVGAYMAYGTSPAAWVLASNNGTANFPEWGRTNANNEESMIYSDIYGPQTATITNLSGKTVDGLIARSVDGFYNGTTQMVGFKISAVANITGTFRVYGYRQA
jgi:hypothetical protein